MLSETEQEAGKKNLAQIPWMRWLLLNRWPQFLARALTLAGFIFAILAGLFGTPVGSHNLAIVFVWIAWWTALKLVFIPLGGRSWCSFCPLPMPGEWLQQGGMIAWTGKRRGLGLKWPKRLQSTWLQSGGFLLIGLFSAVTLTDARLTAWVLLGLLLLATVLSLVFERRAFCRYICPIGGFTGIYAQTAPVEVRAIDLEACRTHPVKSCYQACPWDVYPVALKNNANCGLCMECLRACPKDNLAVNLRSFGEDLKPSRQKRSLDEAFLALVMLGTAISFSSVFLGPWAWLKTAAYAIGSTHWLVYSLGFLFLTVLIVPGLFAFSVWMQGRIAGMDCEVRKEIANQAQALLPLGLFAWIAFTISFAIPKLSLILPVLSDPLGWGWNLFGTANISWSPDLTSISSGLQVAALLLGLFWAVQVTKKVSKDRKGFSFLPVVVYHLLFTMTMMWLLIG